MTKHKKRHGALLEMNVNGNDLLKRTVYLTGTIDDNSAQQCIERLMSLSASGDEPILMLVNSCGGRTSSMFAIHDAIGLIPNEVYVVVMGHALSSAADLVIMQPKGRRFMTPNSTMLIHGVRTGVNGTLNDIENHIERGRSVEHRIEEAILHNTKLTRKKMKRLAKAEQFICSEDAEKWAMVDAVIANINAIITNGQG